jgi:hypothetical protein
MKIIDHGTWVQYTPQKRAENMPPHVLYLKRTSDGVDWYEYVLPDFLRLYPQLTGAYDGKTGEPQFAKTDKPSRFKPGSVFCNIYRHEGLGENMVGTAVRDPTLLFPTDQQVIEITGYQGNGDPHKDFGGKVFRKDSTFCDPVFPEPAPSKIEQRIISALEKITDRLEKLESK